MTTLELIKELCAKKGISIHKLEMDLGFSNGSLSKANSIPLDRAGWIANYFHIPLENLWVGEYPDENREQTATINNIENHDSESTEQAMLLYELYKQASPEIQAAVETLLKSQLRDS